VKQRFEHLWMGGEPVGLAAGKVVCVGRNYLAHIRELGNALPEQAVLFHKPASALVPFEGGWSLPVGRGATHHEAELALLVGTEIAPEVNEAQACRAVMGVTLALDLTLRELQSELKAKGLPWERAKAFDHSCPIAPWLALADGYVGEHHYTLRVNAELRQRGDSHYMIRSVGALLVDIAQSFSLFPGDIVLTGTPAGVAALSAGDKLELCLDDEKHWFAEVGR